MSDIFNNKALQFPLKYVLKVIYIDAGRVGEHNRALEIILSELGIPFRESTFKNSGEGRYVSISTPVEIADRGLFDALYGKLKECPEIKCAM